VTGGAVGGGVGGGDAELHRPPRGVDFVAHNFAAHTSAAAETVWVALTHPDKTAAYFYGMAAHSTWIPDAPVDLRRDDCAVLTGRVLCCRPHERLSYVVQSGETDPPVYLTWSIRPAACGSTIRLEIDEVNGVDSREDAEDIWLPVLAALQRLLDPR
jgi:uncharacterized protein YndB with AHSA1/START domain